MYDFSHIEEKLRDAQEWLREEYKGVRTGRATPTLLDGIHVESYGTRMPLNQVANVGTEDARTLRVSVWDVSQVKAVEKAIAAANLGVGVSSDEKGVRVTFPELTAERRTTLVKLAKEKLEDARQSVRGAREDAWSDIQEKERSSEMSEDEKFRAKDELQKHVDATNEALEALFTKKQEEIEQ